MTWEIGIFLQHFWAYSALVSEWKLVLNLLLSSLQVCPTPTLLWGPPAPPAQAAEEGECHMNNVRLKKSDMNNSKKELAIGKSCFVITVTEEWKNAYMKISIFSFFPCTVILLCLVNCCKCADTLYLSFGKQLPEFPCSVDWSCYLSGDVLMSLQLWLLGQDCWQNWHWLQGWPGESKARARHRGRDLQLLRNSKAGKNRGWQKECLHGKVSLCSVFSLQHV